MFLNSHYQTVELFSLPHQITNSTKTFNEIIFMDGNKKIFADLPINPEIPENQYVQILISQKTNLRENQSYKKFPSGYMYVKRFKNIKREKRNRQNEQKIIHFFIWKR